MNARHMLLVAGAMLATFGATYLAGRAMRAADAPAANPGTVAIALERATITTRPRGKAALPPLAQPDPEPVAGNGGPDRSPSAGADVQGPQEEVTEPPYDGGDAAPPVDTPEGPSSPGGGPGDANGSGDGAEDDEPWSSGN